MAKQYDVVVIGLGPAGMALSAMGTAMGLNVLAIEKDRIGGECLNSGCIPSKALLKMANVRYGTYHVERYGLTAVEPPVPHHPFERIQEQLSYINDEKTARMLEQVDIVFAPDGAHFVDAKTVEAKGERYRARHIFIATGTKPFLPPIKGLEKVDVLTNENLFLLKQVPSSLFILGGGAIGCEMAQAFVRLGTKVVLAHKDEHLLPQADAEAAHVLQQQLEADGVAVYHEAVIQSVSQSDDGVEVCTEHGTFTAEKILVAAGRKTALEGLGLEKAGIKTHDKGIQVDAYGRTNVPRVWAVGDCNGHALLSHAAMHQGMLALMSATLPFLRRMKFRRDAYQVPWSVFTEPEVAQVGETEDALKKKNVRFEAVRANYADYGRTITDGQTQGFVKVLVSPWGKIYGCTAVGAMASEIIHEYILAMHKGIRLHDIMLMQHSFPTVALLNKRVAEIWMMGKMQQPKMQKIIRFIFRLFSR